MNLTLKHFSQATTKPRIIKNLRIAEIQRTCISLHCWCFVFYSVWVMKLNWLVSFILCLFLISFTFDFPWAHWLMLFWEVTYSWHYPYSQQDFGYWKKTFQGTWGCVEPGILWQRKLRFGVNKYMNGIVWNLGLFWNKSSFISTSLFSQLLNKFHNYSEFCWSAILWMDVLHCLIFICWCLL